MLTPALLESTQYLKQLSVVSNCKDKWNFLLNFSCNLHSVWEKVREEVKTWGECDLFVHAHSTDLRICLLVYLRLVARYNIAQLTECVVGSFLPSFDTYFFFPIKMIAKSIWKRFSFNLRTSKIWSYVSFCLPSLPRRSQGSSCFQLDGYLIPLKVMSVRSLCWRK